MTDLVLNDLECRYGEFAAVHDFSLEIRSGEFVTLLGPPGSGKTSILRMIGGYVRPQNGSILIGGRNVTALPPQRRNIGMVFQQYALFPHMRVFDNVAFGVRVRKPSERPSRRG